MPNPPNPERDPLKLQSAFSRPLLDWYLRNRRDLPWRRTKDPYAILVSEIMLQQTQVKTVVPYYERWMQRYPTPQSLADASEAEVLKSWEGLGYYRRARLLHAASKSIVQDHCGKFPHSIKDLGALPGVGRYTLGAVASIAFNAPLPVLDGNVIRVLSRWFGIRENTRQIQTQKQLWEIAETLIPQGAAGDFNQSLMELGATLCVPRKPFCLLCPIRNGCWGFAHGEPEKLPMAVARPAVIRQFEYAGFIVRQNKILLAQRGEGGRMEGLWQFPSVILPQPTRHWSEVWKKAFGSFRRSNRIHALHYCVTHHRIRLELFRIHQYHSRSLENGRWISIPSAGKLAFTAAHRKLADRFLR